MADRLTLVPGTVLGGTYEILRRVAEGGMGELYEARHARLAGRYAVKFLRKDLAAVSSLAFQRFRREAEVTSGLRHPNIVQAIDFNQTADGTPYIVMEFLEGQDLAARLEQRGRLALDEVVQIAPQVASGLAAAHGRGVVHRDLKPQNIFIVPMAGQAGELVKILDFGISKVRTADSLTGEAILVGTPHYMAPEQAMGAGDQIDGATDQFALAGILYELLSGKRPFEAPEVPSVLFAIVHRDPEPLAPLVPAAVENVIRKALSKDKAARYPTIMAFAAALRDAAAPFVREPRDSAARAAADVPTLSEREAAGPGGTGRTPDVGVSLPRTPTEATPQAASGSADGGGHRRPLLVAAAIALVTTAAVAAFWTARASGPRRPVPSASEGRAAALRSRLEASIAEEARGVRAAATAAASVPELQNAVRSRVDALTFNDLFGTEKWWQSYRDLAALVFEGERLLVAHGSDGWQSAPWTVKPSDFVLVAGTIHLAVRVPIAGPGRAELVLAKPLEGATLADMAARIGARLLVMDGKRVLAAAASGDDRAWIESLAGRERDGTALDRERNRLALPFALGAVGWLWAVDGLAPSAAGGER